MMTEISILALHASEFAGEGLELQLPDQHHCFTHDRLVHLARARAAIDEDDRDLFNAKLLSPCAEVHLDLECVPIGMDAVEIDRLEHFASEAFEPAGSIVDR